jgi:hypothetical protein
MMQRTFTSIRARTAASVALIALLIVTLLTTVPGLRGKAAAEPADRQDPPGAATGLGQTSGLLPRDHLTLESALQVDLSQDTVRLPLYPGKGPNGQKAWFTLLERQQDVVMGS